MKEVISTEKGPKAIGPYSQAIKANGLIFTAGQIAFDPATGQIVEGDISQQTVRVFENLKAIVEAAGSSLDKVIKCNVYCTDAAHFATINAVYARYFPSDPPARSFICVSAWHGPFDVEIDCIAAI